MIVHTETRTFEIDRSEFFNKLGDYAVKFAQNQIKSKVYNLGDTKTNLDGSGLVLLTFFDDSVELVTKKTWLKLIANKGHCFKQIKNIHRYF